MSFTNSQQSPFENNCNQAFLLSIDWFKTCFLNSFGTDENDPIKKDYLESFQRFIDFINEAQNNPEIDELRISEFFSADSLNFDLIEEYNGDTRCFEFLNIDGTDIQPSLEIDSNTNKIYKNDRGMMRFNQLLAVILHFADVFDNFREWEDIFRSSQRELHPAFRYNTRDGEKILNLSPWSITYRFVRYVRFLKNNNFSPSILMFSILVFSQFMLWRHQESGGDESDKPSITKISNAFHKLYHSHIDGLLSTTNNTNNSNNSNNSNYRRNNSNVKRSRDLFK